LYRITTHQKVGPFRPLAIIGIARFVRGGSHDYRRIRVVCGWIRTPLFPIQLAAATVAATTIRGRRRRIKKGNPVGFQTGSDAHPPGPIITTDVVIAQANAKKGTTRYVLLLLLGTNIDTPNDRAPARTQVSVDSIPDACVQDTRVDE